MMTEAEIFATAQLLREGWSKRTISPYGPGAVLTQFEIHRPGHSMTGAEADDVVDIMTGLNHAYSRPPASDVYLEGVAKRIHRRYSTDELRRLYDPTTAAQEAWSSEDAILTADEADRLGDMVEALQIEADEKKIRAGVTVQITYAQAELVRAYLDEDCREHLQHSGRWILDGGKLSRALELAGIGVK